MARRSNPNRPPKDWWERCVRGVRKRGGARDAEAVCGAVWYHELSPAARRRASRSENPVSLNPYARKKR